MKILSMISIGAAVCFLLTALFAQTMGLSLPFSILMSLVIVILGFLILERQPKPEERDTTWVRLSKHFKKP